MLIAMNSARSAVCWRIALPEKGTPTGATNAIAEKRIGDWFGATNETRARRLRGLCEFKNAKYKV